MRKVGLLAAILFAFGCAGSSDDIYLQYRMTDRPDLHRIELRYRNDTRSTVCVTPDYWPNQAGKIHYASEYVFLIVANERFPVIAFNTGICNKCAERVAPGKELFGFISYEDFRLPERLWQADKRLEFRPQGFHC